MPVTCTPVAIGYSQTEGEVYPQHGRAITCDDHALPTNAELAAYVTAPSAQQDSATYANGRTKAAQFVIPCKENPRCALSFLGGHASAISGKHCFVQIALLNKNVCGNFTSGRARRILEFQPNFGTNNATAHVPLKVHRDSQSLFTQASWAESITPSFDQSRGGCVKTGTDTDGVCRLDFDTENADAILVSVICTDANGVSGAANGADAVVVVVEWL